MMAMKNKHGFTLIELLAVIVILGIVSLITVGIVFGFIDTVKKNAYKESVKSLFKAVDLYMASSGFIDFPDEGMSVTDENLKIKNKNFISGRIVKNASGELELERVSNGEFCAGGTLDDIKVVKGSCDLLYMDPDSNYYCGPLSANALPSDVLSGKTFYNSSGGQTGTMPINGIQDTNLTITGSDKPNKIIPGGYTPGGTITAELDSSLASSIKQGVTIGGVTGTYTGNPGYKVFTQESQPSGTAGDIWVKTSASVSSILFENNPYLTEEPNDSNTGLSIINAFVGLSNLRTVTITDVNNSLIKRKIPYPVISRYGTAASGVNSYEVYLHNGSNWVKISPALILYAYGYDPYNFQFDGNYSGSNGGLTKNPTHIYGRAYYSGQAGFVSWWSVGPTTPINITNYTKLKAIVKNVNFESYYTMSIGISNNYPLRQMSYVSPKVSTSSTSDVVELTLDISSYTGNYYIMAGMSGVLSSDLRGNLYAMWLE